jgi:pimeloyl-ACP methyl ester carboxylesterase
MIPTFIGLHGALGTATQLDALRSIPGAPELITLHLPGHGGTPSDGDFSNQLFATAILKKMEEHGIEQADFFGYSMGGYVALWMAWQYPEKVRSIITLNTKLDWTPETAARMAGMFDTEKITTKTPQMADALSRAHAPGDWIALAQKTARFLQQLGHGEAIPKAGFNAIACPVKILRGESDNVVSETESRLVTDWIPNGSYAEIAGSKHAIEQVDLAALAVMLR